MYKKTETILDKICAHKFLEIKKRKEDIPLSELKEAIKKRKTLENNFFLKNITERTLSKATAEPKGSEVFLSDPSTIAQGPDRKISLIAEIKRSSPSNLGKPFRENFNIEEIVRIYAQGGARAISVIVDEKFFMGSRSYLEEVARLSSLPILYKEFVIDEYQIYEARSLGASAILLMASILDLEKLDQFCKLANSLGLDVLVEVHDKIELEEVLEIKPQIIGVNNRDLKTLEINLENFSNLSKLIPEGIVRVCESGIYTRADVDLVREAGADAILVGTSLMRASDIGQAISELGI